MIDLQGACARLGRHSLGPFDLRVRPGERIAVLGPSGAGKSTLLKLMSGELQPHRGTVQLDGRALAAWAPAQTAQRRAVLPQSHAVAFSLPVPLVVALGRVAREPDPQRQAIVAAALEQAAAGHLAQRHFHALSGGEQARVQLARVLAQLWDRRGGALLVDEPLAALDPALALDLMDALQHYAAERGHAIVAVLHDLNQALGYFDRLVGVADGRLAFDIASGAGGVPALEAIYGLELRCIDDAEFGLAVVPRRRRGGTARQG